MTGAGDQKIDWNLGETIVWIRTRNHDRVARMWEMSEFEAIAAAFFDTQQLPRRTMKALPFDENRPGASIGDKPGRSDAVQVQDSWVQAPDSMEANESAEQSVKPAVASGTPTHAAQFRSDDPPQLDRILPEIMRRVQTRKVRMTLVKASEVGAKRIPIQAGEAQELELRITEDPVVPTIAWSRTEGAPAGISPWFSRTDVIRAWPESAKKTAAVTGAILRHLREISTSEHPLTKPEALERCLAEVPNAYPEAFKRAWPRLESARKRGRGKHGPRAR